MTTRRDARLLLNSVEEARTKTRDALDPSYFDLGALLVAQSAAVMFAVGHTTDSAKDIVVPALIAAALGVCGVMTLRESRRLGGKIRVVQVAVPIALFVADLVVNFTVHGQGELASRALALGVAGLVLGAFTRNVVTPTFAGVFAFVSAADALNWNPGVVISTLVVAVVVMAIVWRKDLFSIRV
ncbi:MAG: hypothetical protein QOF21_3294 [Actinomycetota bacterium]|jgi:small-conductance mechanosensitive channel